MVDYSKWDRIEFSDSDDDDEGAPRVTSLDSPGRVTIGADGSLEIGQSSLPSNRSDAVVANTEKVRADAAREKDLARKKQKMRQLEELTRNGGQYQVMIQANDADIILPIYWSQDRYVITLRLGFPHLLFPSRSIRVKVLGALNYQDRFSAVGSGAMSGYKEEGQDGLTAFGAIKITSLTTDKRELLLLSDKLPRPIYLNQGEDEIGFDIEDNLTEDTSTTYNTTCKKFVTITFPKAVPMEGMIIWWEHALISLPKIDTSSIQERSNSCDGVMSVEEYNAAMDKKQLRGADSKKEAFAKAWNEAHQLFRDKVKAREKEEVHVDD